MPDPTITRMQENLQKLKPEQQDKVRRFLTPQVAAAMGVLLGDGVGSFIQQIGRMDLQSVPVPKQAVTFLGDEKIQKFFEGAMLKAQEAMEQEAQLSAESRPQGLASPQQQAPAQQAPVSPPAPTGFTNRPQLPLPSSSNATVTDNQPIQ